MSKLPSVKVMDCSDARRWIQRKLDGEELPLKLQKSYKTHLARCPTCSAWASQLGISLEQLSCLSEPRPTLAFQARLMRVLGLSPVSLWLKWGAGVALGLSASWVVSLVLIGDALPGVFNKGLPWAYKTGHLVSLLLGRSAGSSEFLTNLAEVGIFCFVCSVILLVMGILAGRMVNRKPLTARSI